MIVTGASPPASKDTVIFTTDGPDQNRSSASAGMQKADSPAGVHNADSPAAMHKADSSVLHPDQQQQNHPKDSQQPAQSPMQNQNSKPGSSAVEVQSSAAASRQAVRQAVPVLLSASSKAKAKQQAATAQSGNPSPNPTPDPTPAPNMSVTWLGTSSGSPSTRRNVSSIALRHGSNTHVVDCGEGSGRQVLRSAIDPASIVGIYISHLHGDHCFGLPGMIELISAAHKAAGAVRGSKHLTIQGPPGIQHLVKSALAVCCLSVSGGACMWHVVCMSWHWLQLMRCIYKGVHLCLASNQGSSHVSAGALRHHNQVSSAMHCILSGTGQHRAMVLSEH